MKVLGHSVLLLEFLDCIDHNPFISSSPLLLPAFFESASFEKPLKASNYSRGQYIRLLLELYSIWKTELFFEAGAGSADHF